MHNTESAGQLPHNTHGRSDSTPPWTGISEQSLYPDQSGITSPDQLIEIGFFAHILMFTDMCVLYALHEKNNLFLIARLSLLQPRKKNHLDVPTGTASISTQAITRPPFHLPLLPPPKQQQETKKKYTPPREHPFSPRTTAAALVLYTITLIPGTVVLPKIEYQADLEGIRSKNLDSSTRFIICVKIILTKNKIRSQACM